MTESHRVGTSWPERTVRDGKELALIEHLLCIKHYFDILEIVFHFALQQLCKVNCIFPIFPDEKTH